MALFKSKKYLDKQAQAKQAELGEEQKREDAEDFKKREEVFMVEYRQLVNTHHVDFGIVWTMDRFQGPKPIIVRMDVKKFHEQTATKKDGLIKGDGAILKPEDKLNPQ